MLKIFSAQKNSRIGSKKKGFFLINIIKSLNNLNKRIVLMFGELNGAQLFSLTKSDFEKFCGKEEGSRLDSQIRVQKSLCGVN
jgi:hypothetical protein